MAAVSLESAAKAFSDAPATHPVKAKASNAIRAIITSSPVLFFASLRGRCGDIVSVRREWPVPRKLATHKARAQILLKDWRRDRPGRQILLPNKQFAYGGPWPRRRPSPRFRAR